MATQRIHKILPLLALLIAGCAAQSTTSNKGLASTSGGARTNPPANCFTAGVSKPAKLCGQPGYEYLLNTYIRPSCAGCHFTGNSLGLTALADPDPSVAFSAGQVYSPDTWLQRTMHNPFINSECNLLASDGVYADLNTWLQMEGFCN